MDLQDQFVEVEGVSTRFVEVGSGPAVVLLHGGDFRSASSLDDWSTNVPELSRFFRVIAVDKLGQGHTDVPVSDLEYTMTATVRHFGGFLDKMELDRAILIGHSRGALPVAALAVDQPDRVAGLVIFASNTIAPVHPATPTDFYPTAYANRPFPPDSEFVKRELVMNSFSIAHIDDALIRQRLAITALRKTAIAVGKMESLYRSQFLPSLERERNRVLDRIRMDGIRCPVLIVWGRDDPSAPLPLAWQLLDVIAPSTPTTELHIVNQAGHYAYREQPAACNGVVTEFIMREG